jgi:hypothetical protein
LPSHYNSNTSTCELGFNLNEPCIIDCECASGFCSLNEYDGIAEQKKISITSVIDRSDSAEEIVDTGEVFSTSSDLELGRSDHKAQIVGITFRTVDILGNASILNASVLFEIDEIHDGETIPRCPIEIYGEATSSPNPFSESPYNLSMRPKTNATVLWEPERSWDVGDSLITADIATIVKEIISRSDWVVNNSMTILFRMPDEYTGWDPSCARWVESFQLNENNIITPALRFTYAKKESDQQGPDQNRNSKTCKERKFDLSHQTLTNFIADKIADYNINSTTFIDPSFEYYTGILSNAPKSIHNGNFAYSSSDIDLSNTILTGITTFAHSKSNVTITNTSVANANHMFANFTGSINGIPQPINSANSMFAHSNTSIDLTDWNFTGMLNNPNQNMFNHSESTVTITNTSSPNANHMFANFNGVLYGIPKPIASADFMFAHSTSDVNLTDWEIYLRAPSMFFSATSKVTITNLTMDYLPSVPENMFRKFNGSLNGIPNPIKSAVSMFADSSADVDLTDWTINGSAKHMFHSATNAVVLHNAFILDASSMFVNFSNTVSLPPFFLGTPYYMFEDATGVANLTGWNLTADTEYMFWEARNTVILTDTTILSGYNMFANFVGTVDGIPKYPISDTINMFANSDTIVDLTDWSSFDSKNMFNNAVGAVIIDKFTTANAYQMFANFVGTVAGIPKYPIGNTTRMFANSNANVDLTNWSTSNAYQMFYRFKGEISGTPNHIPYAKNMFVYSSANVDLTNWNITNCEFMFDGATGHVALSSGYSQRKRGEKNNSPFTTESADYMFYNFQGAISGTPNPISTAKSMFEYASIGSIDITAWNITASTEKMFKNATTDIFLDGFTIVNGKHMFHGIKGNITGTPNFDPNQFELFFDQTSQITVTDFVEDHDLSFYPHITFICGNSVCQRKSPKNPLSDLALALIIVGSVFLLAGIGFWVKKNGYEALPDKPPNF